MLTHSVQQVCPSRLILPKASLSPSIHKFDDVFIYSGLSAALGHESFDLELMAERLTAEGLRVEDNCRDYSDKNTLWYLRIEALSNLFSLNPVDAGQLTIGTLTDCVFVINISKSIRYLTLIQDEAFYKRKVFRTSYA